MQMQIATPAGSPLGGTSGMADAETLREQVGALCYRSHRGKVEILLITSRDTGRWVIPKGGPMTGLGLPESAAEEAWEEAGVVGAIRTEALGSFAYPKRMRRTAPVPCRVAVFPLRSSGWRNASRKRGSAAASGSAPRRLRARSTSQSSHVSSPISSRRGPGSPRLDFRRRSVTSNRSIPPGALR